MQEFPPKKLIIRIVVNAIILAGVIYLGSKLDSYGSKVNFAFVFFPLIILGGILFIVLGIGYKVATDFKRSLRLLLSVGVGVFVSSVLMLLTRDYWFDMGKSPQNTIVGLFILLSVVFIVAYLVENYVLRKE